MIVWVEIPVNDFKRAVKFYSVVLDLDLQILDCGTEKMACFPNGEGAVSYAPKFKPADHGTLVSLNTGNNLDVTIERIKAKGGKIVQPKTKIEAEGRNK